MIFAVLDYQVERRFVRLVGAQLKPLAGPVQKERVCRTWTLGMATHEDPISVAPSEVSSTYLSADIEASPPIYVTATQRAPPLGLQQRQKKTSYTWYI